MSAAPVASAVSAENPGRRKHAVRTPHSTARLAKPAIHWLSRMLSEGNGTPSTKRVCFFFAIVSSIGIAIGLCLRHGTEALAVDLAKSILLAAGAAYAITRGAEYGPEPGGQNSPPG